VNVDKNLLGIFQVTHFDHGGVWSIWVWKLLITIIEKDAFDNGRILVKWYKNWE
jgi:hypothetical protein